MIQIWWKLCLAVIQLLAIRSPQKFCTCHDSRAVMACAKFCDDEFARIKMSVKRNFQWIWIAMEKKHYWNGLQGHSKPTFPDVECISSCEIGGWRCPSDVEGTGGGDSCAAALAVATVVETVHEHHVTMNGRAHVAVGDAGPHAGVRGQTDWNRIFQCLCSRES